MIIGMVGYREEMKAASHLLASKIQNINYEIQNTRIKHENKIQNKDNRYREMKAAFEK